VAADLRRRPRAREILLLCDEIPAKQAEEWGLVNRAVPAAELDAGRLLRRAARVKLPQTLRYTKQQLNWWRDISWHETSATRATGSRCRCSATRRRRRSKAFLKGSN
jgi:enoyl-CoA hydratase/carnithine racemase